MTVRLEISYDATDGVTPSAVSLEWNGADEPTADDLIRIIQGVGRIAALGRSQYATTSVPPPAYTGPEVDGYRAYVALKAGQICCLRAGSETDVVPLGLGNSPTQECVGPAIEDIPAGFPLLWGAHPTDMGVKTYIWRKRVAP